MAVSSPDDSDSLRYDSDDISGSGDESRIHNLIDYVRDVSKVFCLTKCDPLDRLPRSQVHTSHPLTSLSLLSLLYTGLTVSVSLHVKHLSHWTPYRRTLSLVTSIISIIVPNSNCCTLRFQNSSQAQVRTYQCTNVEYTALEKCILRCADLISPSSCGNWLHFFK